MPDHGRISDEDLDGETRLISVAGAVDLYNAPDFKEAMERALEAGRQRLVFDLSEATFIDSTVLGVIAGASRRLRTTGGSIAIICFQPGPMRVLRISGFDRFFPICRSRDDALRALADEPSRQAESADPDSPSGSTS
ncbi:MAG TPA: STAS domain-containing protein [Solirubrobacteraceae bacterium]|nr:STAS domain-containing protein [Solirubrobacteraceae bacterium]